MHSFIHSFIQSINHSFIHSFIHSSPGALEKKGKKCYQA